MGKLGVVGSAASGGADFLKKLEKYQRNKSKYRIFFAIGGDFFKKSPIFLLQPIFGEIFGGLFHKHFATLFGIVNARNTKFGRNFSEKTDIFNHNNAYIFKDVI